MLPELEYYDLSQLAHRWEVCHSQIQHYVETGKLAAACWLDDYAVIYGSWKRTVNGFEWFEPLSLSLHKGFVGIRKDDARLAFRQETVTQPYFYSLQNGDYSMRLVRENEFILKDDHICVLQEEVRHFENHFSTNSKDSLLQLKDEGHTIHAHGKSYRLGEMQAKVMQQLKEASLAHQPWIHGKILLKNAGSQSFQLKNIFRHQKDWRAWIESDGRGYYRLKI